MVAETGEGYFEAELHRLKGLLYQQADVKRAESGFEQAISIAREQSAKIWELRANVSLCRLWQTQSKNNEAYQRLSIIFPKRTCTNKAPNAAKISPIISIQFNVSPRNNHAKIVIWMSMVLLITLDSIADRVRSV